jgi:hypothetical protein
MNRKEIAGAGAVGCVSLVLLAGAAVWFCGKPAPESAAERAKCRANLQCWAERHFVSALVACGDAIERRAQYSFKWTESFGERKFSFYRWTDQKNGVVTYIGDKVQFQNGFGAWQPFTYECDLDTAREIATAVRLGPGRLR